jgi:Transposase IS66 family/TIR domain
VGFDVFISYSHKDAAAAKAACAALEAERVRCWIAPRDIVPGAKWSASIELEPWLRAKLALISKKSKLAEAIRYALSRWKGLTRFLDDGRVEIDSNVVERSIRPIALNRKNALFADSRWRCRALGCHCFADRNLQAQRPRSTRLPHRRNHQDRQRPSKRPHQTNLLICLVEPGGVEPPTS